jgi:Uma2 family endonuclease
MGVEHLHVAPERISARDFLSWPEDGHRYELVEGEVFMTPAPGEAHQRVVVRLSRLLDEHLETTGQGRVYVAPFDVELDAENVFQPDLLVVLAAHLARVEPTHLAGAPDLAVEVLSPTSARRDRIVKLGAYARAAVPETWVIDPEVRAVEVYRLSLGGRYEAVLEVGLRELSTPLLPGLSIPLGRLFT